MTTPMLSVEGVSHSYGGRRALDNVTFAVAPATFSVMLGLNGAGKSTLFALITRLYGTQHGRIRILDFDAPADDLLKAAEAGKADRILFFNAAATDDRLRQKDCRAKDSSHRAVAGNVGRRTCAIPRMEKMGALVSCRWLARARQALRSGVDTSGEPFRREDRSAAGIQGHRRCSPYR